MSEVLGWLVVTALPAALLVLAVRSKQPSVGWWVGLSGVASLWARLNISAMLNQRYAPTDRSTFWMVALGMPLYLALFYLSAARAAARAWSQRAAGAWMAVLGLALLGSFASEALLIPELAIVLVFVVVVTVKLGRALLEP